MRDRGTTLVELLVVLALMSVMVLVAAELVTQSIRLLGATGRAVRNPMLVHVETRLRNDIQEAGGLLAIEDIWSEEAIDLTTRIGGLIHFEVIDGNLLRRTITPGKEGFEERVLLRGVTSWWWRSPAPNVVDINIGYLISPPPEKQASREVGYEKERRIETLRFAIRGSGGGRQW